MKNGIGLNYGIRVVDIWANIRNKEKKIILRILNRICICGVDFIHQGENIIHRPSREFWLKVQLSNSLR